MKGFATTHKGCEAVAAKEAEEITGRKAETKNSAVTFEAAKEQIVKLVYMGRSINRAGELIAETKITEELETTIKAIKKAIKNYDFKKYKSKNFKVEVEREGKHNYQSPDLEKEAGALIYNQIPDVELTNPEMIVYIHIVEKQCLIGIDYAGRDLSKREYKVFSHPKSLKGTLAYSILKKAGYEGKGILLDPFCGGGETAIEAALYAKNMSVNHYSHRFKYEKLLKKEFEKEIKKWGETKKPKGEVWAVDPQMRNINAAKKNAKIAGADKEIDFSRMAPEWHDIKFEKQSVDFIITNPPAASRPGEKKKVEKYYDDFFYQADYITKKKGAIAILATTNEEEIKKASKKYKVKLLREEEAWSGELKHKLLIYQPTRKE